MRYSLYLHIESSGISNEELVAESQILTVKMRFFHLHITVWYNKSARLVRNSGQKAKNAREKNGQFIKMGNSGGKTKKRPLSIKVLDSIGLELMISAWSKSIRKLV